MRRSNPPSVSVLRFVLAAALSSCAHEPAGAQGERAVPSPLASAGLRRLNHREYDAVVRDLVGNIPRSSWRALGEAYQNGYDKGSAGLVVQADQAAEYDLPDRGSLRGT